MDKNIQFKIASMILLALAASNFIILIFSNNLNLGAEFTSTLRFYAAISVMGVISSFGLSYQKTWGIVIALVYFVLQIVRIQFGLNDTSLDYTILPKMSFSWGSIWLDINLTAILMLVWLSSLLVKQLKSPIVEEVSLKQEISSLSDIFNIKRLPTEHIMVAIFIVAAIAIVGLSYRLHEASKKVENLTYENAVLKQEGLSDRQAINSRTLWINAELADSDKEKSALAMANSDLEKKITELNQQLLDEGIRDLGTRVNDYLDIQLPSYPQLQRASQELTTWEPANWDKNKQLKERYAFKTHVEKLSSLLDKYNKDKNNDDKKINLDKLSCGSDIVVVYSDPYRKDEGQLIRSSCYYKNNNKYPLTFKRTHDRVSLLLNLPILGFQNNGWILTTVTDINEDGNLELWLSGVADVCRGKQEYCRGESSVVVEEFNNIALLRHRD